MPTTKTLLQVDQYASFSANVTNGSGIEANLLACTCNGAIRKHFDSNTATTFTVVAVDSNTVTLSLTADVTANIESGRHTFDVTAVTAANTTIRIAEGIVVVNPAVTR